MAECDEVRKSVRIKRKADVLKDAACIVDRCEPFAVRYRNGPFRIKFLLSTDIYRVDGTIACVGDVVVSLNRRRLALVPKKIIDNVLRYPMKFRLQIVSPEQWEKLKAEGRRADGRRRMQSQANKAATAIRMKSERNVAADALRKRVNAEQRVEGSLRVAYVDVLEANNIRMSSASNKEATAMRMKSPSNKEATAVRMESPSNKSANALRMKSPKNLAANALRMRSSHAKVATALRQSDMRLFKRFKNRHVGKTIKADGKECKNLREFSDYFLLDDNGNVSERNALCS